MCTCPGLIQRNCLEGETHSKSKSKSEFDDAKRGSVIKKKYKFIVIYIIFHKFFLNLGDNCSDTSLNPSLYVSEFHIA